MNTLWRYWGRVRSWSCMEAFPEENRIPLSFCCFITVLLQSSLTFPKKMMGVLPFMVFKFLSLARNCFSSLSLKGGENGQSRIKLKRGLRILIMRSYSKGKWQWKSHYSSEEEEKGKEKMVKIWNLEDFSSIISFDYLYRNSTIYFLFL